MALFNFGKKEEKRLLLLALATVVALPQKQQKL